MITRRAGLLTGIASLAIPGAARAAEDAPIRLTGAFGISYVPTYVVLEQKLIEKHAAKLGINPAVDFRHVSTGGAINDALLSDSADVAPVGGPILVYLWAKTRAIRGVISLVNSSISLLSVDPRIKTIADYTDDDRIAMTTVKISTYALILQMAAVKAFGWDQRGRFDTLSVSLGAAESAASLLSGGAGGITSACAELPFSDILKESPHVHEVLNSIQVLGSIGTFTTLGATAKFHAERPKSYQAVKDAFDEAIVFMNQDKKGTAEIYSKYEPGKKDVAWLTKMFEDETHLKYSRDPNKLQLYADFIHKLGNIPRAPASWKDLFFDDGAGLNGS